MEWLPPNVYQLQANLRVQYQSTLQSESDLSLQNSLQKISSPICTKCFRYYRRYDNDMCPDCVELGDIIEDYKLGVGICLDLTRHYLSSLPPGIGLFTSIQILDISNNKLNYLPQAIGNLHVLQQFYAGQNALSGLPYSMSTITTLEIIYLNNNQISDQTLLGRLSSLQKLILDYNKIYEIDLSVCRNLCNLHELYLENTQLHSLPKEISRLTSLKVLNIKDNKLTDLPAEIGYLISLEVLILKCNKLQTLPAQIGNLIHLSNLDIMYNQLCELPPTIGNLYHLRLINLSYNRLLTIPPTLGYLTSLFKMDLTYNGLTDIPSTFDNLISMKSLDIRYNNITHLPATLNSVCEHTLWIHPNPIKYISKKLIWYMRPSANILLAVDTTPTYYFSILDHNMLILHLQKYIYDDGQYIYY